MIRRTGILALFCWLFCWMMSVLPGGAVEAFAEGTGTRSLRSARLAVTYQSLLAEPFGAGSGPGLSGIYEFALTPRFLLGVELAYRRYAGNAGVSQLGYGLLFKHPLVEDAEHVSVLPYLEYGLLMNVTRQKDVAGSGTSHDTRLTVGSDFKIGSQILCVDFSYHYSRLGFFGAPTTRLDYLETAVGWRFRW